ncbi:hypothetical protein [Nocardia sp. NPDC004722]
MTNETPPPLAALHEPWGWVKRLLVVAMAGVLVAGLEVRDLVLLRRWRPR